MTGTILDMIVETKRGEVQRAKSQVPLNRLKEIISHSTPPRDFYGSLCRSTASLHVIAEIKKASPSAGLIRPDFDPVSIAGSYEAGGATALSVLTDETYFQGRNEFISMVKGASKLPVLRKDFVIDEYQVHESRAIGADAILLIAAIVSDANLDAWSRLAFELGMSSLVEVHNADELRRVQPFISPQRRAILGINNRDLKIQRTDLTTTSKLAAVLAPGTSFISESGIKSFEDMTQMKAAGAMGVLVGESLMKSDNPGEKLKELIQESKK